MSRAAKAVFGSFEFDPSTGRLTKHGRRIKLRPQAALVLARLLETPGQLVTRAELQRRLWSDGTFVDFDRGLNAAIKKLRDALADSADEPKYLQTVHGEGYRFIGEISSAGRSDTQIENVAPAPFPETLDQPILESVLPRAPAHRKAVLALLAFCVLAAAVSLVGFHVSPESTAFPRRGWVLIMKLDNRTGDAEFDGTLNYALEAELGNSQYVNVVESKRIDQQLQYMRRKPGPVADLETAREVCLRDDSIQAILAPRIERIGSSYQVSSAVVSCENGSTLAVVAAPARDASAVLSAINDLSTKIRNALGEAPVEAKQKLAAATTTSLDALKLFTEAQKSLSTAKPDDIDSAIRLLKQAIAIDPEFAMAWSDLAGAITWRSEFTVPPTTLRYDDAGPYYERSAQLVDHTTAREKYIILGRYHQNWTMDLEKEVAAFEALHALYPDDLSAMGPLGFAYARAGRVDDAERLYLQLADQQKNSFETTSNSWLMLCNIGRCDDAEYLRRRGLSLATPPVKKLHPYETIAMEVTPIFSLLNQGNVDGALRQSQELESQYAKADSDLERYSLIFFIFKVYFDTGQLKLAENWAHKTTVHSDGFARYLSYARGDMRTYRTLMLREISKNPNVTASAIFSLIDFGMRGKAEAMLARLQHDRRTPSLSLVNAELDRNAGQLAKAIREYRAVQAQVDVSSRWIEPVVLDRLAHAQEDSGDIQGAITTLEVNAREPVVPLIILQPPWRAEARLHLARLYRKTGRTAEAEKIENGLRNLYRYADADFAPSKELRETPDPTTTSNKRPPRRAAGS